MGDVGIMTANKVWFAALVGLLGVLLMAQELGPLTQAFPPHLGYETEELVSPKAYGLQLTLFVSVLKVPLLGDLILAILKKQNNFQVMRQLAAHLDVLPTYRPLKLMEDDQLQKTKQLAEDKPYHSILTDSKFRDEFLYACEDCESKHKDYIANDGLLTIDVIHNVYASGKRLPSQVMEEVLSNADGLKHLNLFISLNESDVREQGRASDLRWKKGQPLSVLDGVPIGIKDGDDVRGYVTTSGTKYLQKRNVIAKKDSPIVARLRSLGAIIVGKLNMQEVGVSPHSVNPNYGTVMNPMGESRDAGGSSSGSAAAVACGLFPLTVGADGGGSLRVPASATGTVGLSATYGRIPFFPGGAWSNLHPGLIAATVRDQMIGYAAVSGALPRMEYEATGTLGSRSASLNTIGVSNPPIHFDKFDEQNDISDLTLGVYWYWFSDADSAVVSHCDALLKFLNHRFNVKIKNITIPHLTAFSKAHLATISSEFIAKQELDYRSGESDFLEATLVTLLFGRQISGVDLLSAMKVRTYAMDYLDDIFNKQSVDIIVTPTMGVLPPYLSPEVLSSQSGLSDLVTTKQMMKFIQLGNLIGIPGLSIPIGYARDEHSLVEWEHLPIGLQLYSDHWNEHKLFRLGAFIEERMFSRQFPPSHNRARYTFN